MSTHATPSKVDLLSDPQPPLHAEPLGALFLAQLTADDEILRPEEITPTSRPDLHAAVNEALRLAIQLVIHPRGITLAAEVLSGTESPHPMVTAAIRSVFSRLHFGIGLVSGWRKSSVGLHIRPSINLKDDANTRLKAVTLLLNTWHMDRLFDAYTDRVRNPDYHIRMLFLVSIAIAHELIHLLRRQVGADTDRRSDFPDTCPVQVYRLLQRYPEVSIPYDSPGMPVGGKNQIEWEAGWFFESNLVGGPLHGLWARNEPSPPEHEQPREQEPFLPSDLETALDKEDLDMLFEAGQRNQEPKKVAWDEPFDYLAVQRGSDQKYYEVTDEWLTGMYDGFTSDVFHNVHFPPDIDPVPLELGEIAVILARDDQERPRDVVRPGPPFILF